MQRIKLTEKLIRSIENESNSQPIILADTEIRSLQVFVYVFLATYRFKKSINGKRYNIKIGNVDDIKLTVARAIAQELGTEIRSKRHLPHSSMLVREACTKILIPRYTNFGKDKNPLGIIKNFLILFFGDVKIGELTPLMVQNVIYKLMDDGYAAETIRKRISLGKILYKQLIKYQLVNFNPFNDLDLPKVSNIRTVDLKPEQRLPFIHCCLEENSVYADLLLLLLYTGLRVSEGIRIRLEDISDDYSTLTLPKTKAGVVQYISLNTLAQEVLHRRADLSWNQYLFPSTVNSNKPISAPKGCFIRIKERMRVIGHNIDNLHIHDLRSLFATVCAEVTGDMYMVATQLRHSSINVLKKYIRFQHPNIAIASEATAQALLTPIETQHEQEAKS